MKVSIIIVNYKAKAFLDLCLQSVKKAVHQLDAEVIVVDNTSQDGSLEMISQKHPWVQVIANQENVGFSKANNQAIQIAKGDYIIIQNPDTIVAEDTYLKCINFLSKHHDVGAVGVKMLDGSGDFLPESKRGLPTPATAFFKAFGFAQLFPTSRIFGRYYLGHLPHNQDCEVEILAGAYMCVRKLTLDKAGLFDEDFFMFGEDIDLSYRFTKAGYKNWYLSNVPIIHFKGESSKKTDTKYLNSFFGAMDIFYNKHFISNGKSIFRKFISLGIFIKRLMYSTQAKRSEKKQAMLPQHMFVPMANAHLIDEIKKLLPSHEIKITACDTLENMPTTSDAALVFTDQISFKDALTFMESHRDKYTYFFLSENNECLLSSPKSDLPGIVIESEKA